MHLNLNFRESVLLTFMNYFYLPKQEQLITIHNYDFQTKFVE